MHLPANALAPGLSAAALSLGRADVFFASLPLVRDVSLVAFPPRRAV